MNSLRPNHPPRLLLSRPAPGFGLRRSLACLALAVALPFAPHPAAAAQSTNQPALAPARPDYSSFRLVTERNIFNQRRYARSTPRTETTRRYARVDSLALVGTMQYEKGLFAFFDGSSSEYRKVLTNAESVAGFKLARIEPSGVKLTSGTNEIDLQVGMQLRREEGGEWRPGGAAEPRTTTLPSMSAAQIAPPLTAAAATTNGMTNGEPQAALLNAALQAIGMEPPPGTEPPPDYAPASAPPEPSGGGETDPVLLRLMQRRAQENNQ